ncbi:hypothetical protein IM792_12965 [Mucilaginibacter sp. JRF]|uniref:hypothetical protein n=1 Tax=Mucilaginibacter sp. JRF TaxID=2780088 RepID=UPI001881C8D5|nr:hypothetical protein [Mucilaginibacter sp. JRF]MBE9585365.1 hypothetical protein [Mucilaginibacter sp. JRF]
MIIGKPYKQKFLSNWRQWLKVTLHGYNYGNIMANELAGLYHYDEKSVSHLRSKYLKHGIKDFLIALLFKQTKNHFDNELINADAQNTQTIHFLMEDDGRDDYKRQCRFVLDQLSDYRVKVYTVNKFGKGAKQFNVASFLSKCRLLLNIARAVKLSNAFEHDTRKKNLFVLTKCLHYHDILTYVEQNKLLVDAKLLIVFADMKECGSMMVQAARKLNIKTATLQHAIYLKRKDNEFSHSVINYLNSQADYVLGWGESVLPVYQDNVANPRQQVLLSGTSDATYSIDKFYQQENDVKADHGCFSVFFSGQTLRMSNMKMLAIAEEVANKKGFKYKVLMHPSNKPEDYSFDQCTGLAEALKGSAHISMLINSSDFCICHNTTVYFTVMLKHKPCFRFKDEVFVDYGGLDDIFSDGEGLLKKVNSVSGDKQIEKIEQILIRHFGESGFSYKQSIRQILADAV